MTTLTVNIDNQTNAKSLAAYLRSLGYVKSVTINKVKNLQDDLILPGAKIDVDALFEEMDCDNDEGISTKQLEKEIAQWSKGIYK